MRSLKGPSYCTSRPRRARATSLPKDPIGYHAVPKFNRTVRPAQERRWQADLLRHLRSVAVRHRRQGTSAWSASLPAMREGLRLVKFSQQYPDRYFDVAIAEQHAVTFAAGLAIAGQKPVVAIYSSFLQRAYDQLIHDVALQNLPVLFAIDRAPVSGGRRPHPPGGLRHQLPAHSAEHGGDDAVRRERCRQMLYTGYQHNGPAAVRYPAAAAPASR